MNRQANVAKFLEVYQPALAEVVTKHPDKYAYPVTEVPVVAERMRSAFETGSYNHDGLAIKWACKRLGIRHTRKALEEFFGPR